MGWTGSLDLHYRQDRLRGQARTVLHDRHDGPLRVLASLQPEGPQVCHNVLVHPPGGLVGGDLLGIDLRLDAGTHALLTTPGATRYYRSNGAPAVQRVQATLAEGARLEWLPLETLAYSGCLGENHVRCTLAPGAEMLGWDLLALGLPAADQAFERGHFLQSVELPGRWLERGRIAASDTHLLDSPLGWAGHRVMGLLWFAAGAPLAPRRRTTLLDAARTTLDREPRSAAALQAAPSGGRSALPATVAGVSAVHDDVLVLRVLAPRVEPAMQLMTAVWSSWRALAWDLPACAPRVWRT